MKISIYVSLLCIALFNVETYAMHASNPTVNDRGALKHTYDGVPSSRKKLSISDQELGNKLRTVLKPVPSQSFDSDGSDESEENESDNEEHFKYGIANIAAQPKPSPWIPVSSNSEASRMIAEHMNTDNLPQQPEPSAWSTTTLDCLQISVSTPQNVSSRTPSPEQPRTTTPYPAQRLMLGLTVEWLHMLPDERISVEGLDSVSINTEQKHVLIEHVRATHNAVRHTLDIDNRTLAIDVSKLPECLQPKTQILNAQAPIRSFLSAPLLTGGVCFVLGYILAKKLSNASH